MKENPVIQNLFVRSFIQSFIDSFSHSLIHSCSHFFIHSLVHSFIHSFVHSIRYQVSTCQQVNGPCSEAAGWTPVAAKRVSEAAESASEAAGRASKAAWRPQGEGDGDRGKRVSPYLVVPQVIVPYGATAQKKGVFPVMRRCHRSTLTGLLPKKDEAIV